MERAPVFEEITIHNTRGGALSDEQRPEMIQHKYDHGMHTTI